ncbi:MAG TPA: hypothetical protein VFE01_05605 [Terracidiphilus sp.]|nr:hypothetical protein [Terracidiphilus sp.]
MNDIASQRLSLLARTAAAVAILLLVTGIMLNGISSGVLERFWSNLIERPDGPMKFRFVLQPLMAAIAAIRDARADARSGRPPWLVEVLGNSEERAQRLREGLNATARIILLGVVVDTVYQLIALGRFYPAEASVVALALALIPYVIIRSLARQMMPARGTR